MTCLLKRLLNHEDRHGGRPPRARAALAAHAGHAGRRTPTCAAERSDRRLQPRDPAPPTAVPLSLRIFPDAAADKRMAFTWVQTHTIVAHHHRHRHHHLAMSWPLFRLQGGMSQCVSVACGPSQPARGHACFWRAVLEYGFFF